MSKMIAAIRRKYCSPNQIKIESIDKPIPKEDEVLIRVYITTVNRTDCANLTARPFIMRFAFNDTGSESHAEYITTTEENLFPIPEKINYKQAAASLEAANYAYTFIHKVNINQGQNILINGATGGIGSALLQFVRQYDVKITATCNTKNMELIKSLGADKIYDYNKEDFTNDDDKYDFIFDAVGKSTFGKCKPLLKEKGIYISSELGPYSQNIFYVLITLFLDKKVIFPIPYSKQKTIPYISNLLKKGKFTPIIDREYSFEDISKAYEYVITGQKTGNVLINV